MSGLLIWLLAVGSTGDVLTVERWSQGMDACRRAAVEITLSAQQARAVMGLPPNGGTARCVYALEPPAGLAPRVADI